MSIEELPVLNAALNACATVFLILGIVFIKSGRKRGHIICMSTALIFSAAFLASYLVYHFNVGHVRFAGTGLVRTIYFSILFTHLPLAIINLPMIIMTVVPALRSRYDKHKRMAKFTFPIWLYVSVTGVIIYFMCYQWFGPPLR
jgi:putative membrane protein